MQPSNTYLPIITDVLNNNKTFLLRYLLNDETFILDNTINIKEIKIDAKWEFLLSYPDQLRRFRYSENFTLKDLTLQLIEILKITDVQKQARMIHPGILILCHDLLGEAINFKYLGNTSIISIKSKIEIKNRFGNVKKLELREQTINCFQIYTRLLNHPKLMKFYQENKENEIKRTVISNIWFQFEIEKLINMSLKNYDSKTCRLADYVINLLSITPKLAEINSKKYLLFEKFKEKNEEYEDLINFYNSLICEFQESHHAKTPDIERKYAVFKKTGQVSMEYFSQDTKFEDFINQLLKNIAKLIYLNIDEKFGILFYMSVIDDFVISLAPFFLDLHEKTKIGVKVKYLGEQLKNISSFKRINDYYLIIKNILTYNDNTIKAYFKTYDKNNFNESILNSLGVDKFILSIPRDLYNAQIEIEINYNKFKEGYFNLLFNFLETDNDHEEMIDMVIKKTAGLMDVSHLTKYTIEFILEQLKDYNIRTYIESKHNIQLNGVFPILQEVNKKGRYHDVVSKQPLKNILGPDNPICEIIDDIDYGHPNMDGKIISHKIMDEVLELSKSQKDDLSYLTKNDIKFLQKYLADQDVQLYIESKFSIELYREFPLIQKSDNCFVSKQKLIDIIGTENKLCELLDELFDGPFISGKIISHQIIREINDGEDGSDEEDSETDSENDSEEYDSENDYEEDSEYVDSDDE